MTNKQYESFARDLDLLCDKYFNGDYEEFIKAQAELARKDATKQEHPEVRACLEGMAEYLDSAAMNFYCSFK